MRLEIKDNVLAYEHLRITKEQLINIRRKRKLNFSKETIDIVAHSQKLTAELSDVINVRSSQVYSDNDNFVFKIDYSKYIDTEHLSNHGIDFVSQENTETIVVCADKDGLDVFNDHLVKLGLNDKTITYNKILHSIQKIESWTSEDRKSWAIKHKGFPTSDAFLLDIELWPIFDSSQDQQRKDFIENFKKWLQLKKIQFRDQLNLDSFILIRVEVAQNHLDELLNHNDIKTIYLLPTTGITYQQLNVDINQLPINILTPDNNAVKICILDSGINSNHPLLKSAMGDSVNFTKTESASDFYGHGTSVASVALYGDLEACNESGLWEPELWILNGKILDNNGEYEVELIENTIDKAVRYFVDQYQCKIFNLSIGNTNAPYEGNHIKGLAYTLDQLARELDVLFIVSAGNFNDILQHNSVQKYANNYPNYLLSDHTTLIDPAPALNVLTVGSIAKHEATYQTQKNLNIISGVPIAKSEQPSPFTRHGPSNKGAIKPDLVAVGGNTAVDRGVRVDQRGIGVLTCNYAFAGNTLFNEVSGTSFAAPYITHLAGRLLNNYPIASANLLRALLVNHADMTKAIKITFSKGASYRNNSGSRKEPHLDVAGYGLVNESELFRSSEQVVGLIAEEQIENDKSQFFELPIPDDFFTGERRKREIRVTLAYCPAVRTTRQDYVATKISFHLVNGQSLEDVEYSFNNNSKKDSDPIPDINEGRIISQTTRSKGTVQSSVWSINNCNEKYFIVVTRQDKGWTKGITQEFENYALVVTLTDRENENATLYTQIKERIELKNQERVRV